MRRLIAAALVQVLVSCAPGGPEPALGPVDSGEAATTPDASEQLPRTDETRQVDAAERVDEADAGDEDAAPDVSGHPADAGPSPPDRECCTSFVHPQAVELTAPVGGSQALPVEIQSCAFPTTVTGIALTPDSSPSFSLDLRTLPGFEAGGAPSPETPLVVPLQSPVGFGVIYRPTVASAAGPDGSPIPEAGRILVANHTYDELIEVELRGVATAVDAGPFAVAIVDEGTAVIPQTVLHLRGDQSIGATGPVVHWRWSVEQPEGSRSKLSPSVATANPVFEANVAGLYRFQLTVWDEGGAQSTTPGTVDVLVVPDEVVHVELLWDTPGDPDQTDSGLQAGADLDLHFLHPYAYGPDRDGDGTPDGWFDVPFDCHRFNPNPNWATFDPSVDDDPGLDLEDADGAGPENLNLNGAEDGLSYRIGVHAWAEHGYGPSWATVRVYLFGALAYERADVKLHEHDLWDVGTLTWPDATFVPRLTDAGGDVVTPGVVPPGWHW